MGAQVVNFIRLGLLNDARQVAAVAEVAVVQLEAGIVDMRVLVEVVYALGVERAGPALDAVDGVAFFKQEFSQVGAVLARAAAENNGGDFCVSHGLG